MKEFLANDMRMQSGTTIFTSDSNDAISQAIDNDSF